MTLAEPGKEFVPMTFFISTLIAEVKSTLMSRFLAAVKVALFFDSPITLYSAERRNYYGLLLPLGVSSPGEGLAAQFLDFLLRFE